MDKTKNVYSKEIRLNVVYTYDKNYNKVYDIKKMKKQFSNLIDKLKR